MAAETGRNDGHGLVNAETEKESNRDLQSLFYAENAFLRVLHRSGRSY